MRAQASLEYLLLACIALSLLSVSVLALTGIRGSAEQGFETFQFQSSSLALSNAINELCASGNGNGREVRLAANISVESVPGDNEWLVRFSNGNLSMVRASRCDVSAVRVPAGAIYAKNEEGEIILKVL